ncbi:hypothetical protein [Phenylobacterium sp.]|uniref:hypothetical protein n=1 Tax=Phenylobacterium sp. TaxID=1871053 RepID=UPI0035B438E2
MIILKTQDGVLDPADEGQFTALEQRLKAGDVSLLLHLHGGLVDEAHGVKIATDLGGDPPLGFGLGEAWEDVFVLWRTGFLETLETNWTDLFDNDRLYKTLLKRLLDFAVSKLGVPSQGGRSLFAAMDLSPTEIEQRLDAKPEGDPFADIDLSLGIDKPGGRGPVVAAQTDVQIAQDFMTRLQQDREFNRAVDDIAAALAFDTESSRSLSKRGDPDKGALAFKHLDAPIKEQLLAATPPEREGRALFTGVQAGVFILEHAGKVAVRVIKRFRTKRDHGFYATVVEELVRELYGDLIGAAVWGFMKTDAADHFKAGALGDRLLNLLAAHPPKTLAVNGHSAGSIWASQMLIAMDGRAGLPPIRLSFMAPAVRTDLFAQALDKSRDRIAAFRMFTMRDELERIDAVLGKKYGFLYPSSLLYLISGVLEDRNAAAFADAPILGLQRFLTGNAAWVADAEEIAAIGKVMALLAAPTSGLVLSQVSGGPGLSSQATSHGGFDQDADTVASVALFARPQ